MIHYFFLLNQIITAQKLVVSIHERAYVHEAYIVSEKEFTLPAVRLQAMRFLSRNRSAKFGKLELSSGPGVRFYSGKGGDHVSIENYFYRLSNVYSDGVKAYGNIASLLKVGPEAILRVRLNGKVTTVDFSEDTSAGLIRSPGAEILHIGPVHNGQSIGGVEVFVRMRREVAFQEKVEELAERIRQLGPYLTVRVYARTDPWFILEPGFPFIYAFDSFPKLPTPEAYMQGRRLYAERSEGVRR